jgi:hypothetical protein
LDTNFLCNDIGCGMRITGYGSHYGKTLNGNGDVASAEHLSGIDT